jgi:hypothetical protein
VRLSGSRDGARGPEGGAKGSCGTPGTHWVSSPGPRGAGRSGAPPGGWRLLARTLDRSGGLQVALNLKFTGLTHIFAVDPAV